MEKRIATELGVDISTSGFKTAVRDRDGEIGYVSLPMTGAVQVLGQPAFCLDPLANLFHESLTTLANAGWSFHEPGRLSWSFRQHDMALVGASGEAVLSALSWECSAAEEQVKQLVAQQAEQTVGKIEARFVLPKLLWVLKNLPALKEMVAHVMTSGDYLAWQLTGQMRLSASDALSNALLDQHTRQLAREPIAKAGVPVEWFPPVIKSGERLGIVSPRAGGVDIWSPVRRILANWSVQAGLGDNHAAALGSGLTDHSMIVLSAGSSGTITRMTTPQRPLAGKAVCFEYFDDRLLLMMLHRCALWYNNFLEQEGRKGQHDDNNRDALACELGDLIEVSETQPPADWNSFSLPRRIACTQYSIALGMLRLVKQMLAEVNGGEREIQTFVLTGGLTNAPLFREVLAAGLDLLLPGSQVRTSIRKGSIAFENATVGALLNASLDGSVRNNVELLTQLCPSAPIAGLQPDRQQTLQQLLAKLL